MASMDEFARTPEQQASGKQACLERAREWRLQAGHVRGHAAQLHLAPDVRAGLLHSADACDAQAAWWEAGAQDYELALTSPPEQEG